MAMHSGYSMLRAIRREDELKKAKISRGTTRRVLRFARPFRRDITIYLVAVVADAVIGVATPVLAGRVVNAITAGGPSASGAVVRIASLIAALAIADSLLSLFMRWYSARIGEGSIYQLRTQVYDHVQRMPLQFFTRTQTGALVSRLNNDVIGAQQAFTSTLSGIVSNVIQLILVVGAMLALSWQLTVVAILMLPIFLIPARILGRRLAAMTRQQMQLNAEMSTTMTERFSVGGALLVTLFGHPKIENRAFGNRAGEVRDLGIRIAMLGRVFFTA